MRSGSAMTHQHKPDVVLNVSRGESRIPFFELNGLVRAIGFLAEYITSFLIVEEEFVRKHLGFNGYGMFHRQS